MRIQESTTVNAPLERVWPLLSDLDKEPEFWKGTVAVRTLGRDGDVVDREVTIRFRNARQRERVYLHPPERLPPLAPDVPARGAGGGGRGGRGPRCQDPVPEHPPAGARVPAPAGAARARDPRGPDAGDEGRRPPGPRRRARREDRRDVGRDAARDAEARVPDGLEAHRGEHAERSGADQGRRGVGTLSGPPSLRSGVRGPPAIPPSRTSCPTRNPNSAMSRRLSPGSRHSAAMTPSGMWPRANWIAQIAPPPPPGGP